MKKLLYIIIFGLFFSGCETKKEKEFKKSEFFYPRASNHENDTLLISIHLDSIKNYGELIAMADRISCNGKSPVLQFRNEKEVFHLLVHKECSESFDIVDFSGRNVISIEKDSIKINDEIQKPFASLDSVLKNHFLNPHKKQEYPQETEKAVIFYYQDSLHGIDKIKNQFIKLTTEFNRLNEKTGDSLSLKVKLSEYPYIRTETPPFPEN